MKSWAAEHPERALSRDLSHTDLARTGFWWCQACKRVTELEETARSEGDERCVHCGSGAVEWHPPIGPEPTAAIPIALPQLPIVAVPPKRLRHRRLPAEKRDLRVLARSGFYFCGDCENITERDEHDECILCGSANVTWNEPVFKEVAA